MKFQWTYIGDTPLQIKTFLKNNGISKKMLAKIKFQGGKITVDQVEQNVLFYLKNGQIIEIDIPSEKPHETLLADDIPIDIIFEDEHLLIVNKPAGIPSIPAQYHPRGTMANRVKHYICQQNYENQVVHIVTRLDKDTSGLMIFAKHGFAHAKLDQQLRQKTLIKKYWALVSDPHHSLHTHDTICLPIARTDGSIMQRTVADDGKYAETEYWLQTVFEKMSLVDIQLHTGRTHQIRVHFSAIGCPLLGDDMYGGLLLPNMQRQALHCHELHLIHPFTQEKLQFTIPLPNDMENVIQQQYSS